MLQPVRVELGRKLFLALARGRLMGVLRIGPMERCVAWFPPLSVLAICLASGRTSA